MAWGWQPKEIFIDADKLTLHGLSQFYIKLEEGQKTRKLTDLMDILGERLAACRQLET